MDLISRQNAIRWVKTECNPYGKPTLDFDSGVKVIEHLKKMPSAERKGKWIEDARTYYETLNERGYFVDQHTEYFVDDIACSECLKRFSTIDNETERFDFCPNCGADMRGEEDE